VTSAFTVVGPFVVPATVAVLVTLARLMATAAPIAAGGPRAAVAVPSAVAFASLLAADQIVMLLAPSVTPDGRSAVAVVLERLTAIAAATATAPPEVFGDGAAGSEPAPVAPLFVASVFENVRLPPTWASGVVVALLVSWEPFALDSADVAVDADVARFVADVAASMPPIGGVIHAAGVKQASVLDRRYHYPERIPYEVGMTEAAVLHAAIKAGAEPGIYTNAEVSRRTIAPPKSCSAMVNACRISRSR